MAAAAMLAAARRRSGSSSSIGAWSLRRAATSDAKQGVVVDEQRGTAARVVVEFKTPIREFKMPKIANAKMTGLRTTRRLITVIRGPHIDKKSREQFDIQTRKWRVTIDTETNKLRDKLEFLKQHRVLGVEVKAKFNYMTRLAWPLQPTRLSDTERWRLFKLRSQDPVLNSPAKLASEFNITEEQVYDVLRSVEERVKHRELFGSSSSSSPSPSSST